MKGYIKDISNSISNPIYMFIIFWKGFFSNFK